MKEKIILPFSIWKNREVFQNLSYFQHIRVPIDMMFKIKAWSTHIKKLWRDILAFSVGWSWWAREASTPSLVGSGANPPWPTVWLCQWRKPPQPPSSCLRGFAWLDAAAWCERRGWKWGGGSGGRGRQSPSRRGWGWRRSCPGGETSLQIYRCISSLTSIRTIVSIWNGWVNSFDSSWCIWKFPFSKHHHACYLMEWLFFDAGCKNMYISCMFWLLIFTVWEIHL